MFEILLQALCIYVLTRVVWSLTKALFIRSPLDNIPGPPSRSFLYGHLKDLLAVDSWPLQNLLVESYAGVASLKGPLGGRMLYVYDPTALHHILVKDQHVYEEGRFFLRSNELVFGKGLLSTVGDQHKKQRKMLNPVFSPNHMRYMIPTFYEVGRTLVHVIRSQLVEKSSEVDMADWAARASLEVMGHAGLGYSFNSLLSDEPDAYAAALHCFSYAVGQTEIPRRILPYLPDIRVAGIGRAALSLFPHDGVRQLQGVADVFWARASAIYQEKKRALEQGDAAAALQVGGGKDLMSILLKANMGASGEDKLEEDELISQMSTLIMAAVDTTSNALSDILDHLAKHPDVQQRLREEIIEAGADKGLDFDALMGLPYLEAVCRETLRVCAPFTQVFREAREDIVLPISKPMTGVDGSTVREILVPKNTTIVAGLLNCNRNKELWGEDAFEWKPERWLAPLPTAVTEAKIPGVYSNLMTFLGGGRACIGFKFSQLEMKVLLSLLLANFVFEPSEKPVIWNLGGVRFPSIGEIGGKPGLPMKIRPYKARE
ncbi:cytochrome P450 [Trametes polyzona]|nr:cytochrome P450 [Trametes polyzona]